MTDSGEQTEINSATREILSIHIGQAGIQIGQAVWELFTAEHGIYPDGTLRSKNESNAPSDRNAHAMKSIFEESLTGQLVPRSLMVDLEATVLDDIRAGHYRGLFHPDRMINTYEDAANNYARGYYTHGNLILRSLKDELRKVMEECDNLLCFLIYRSLGGGTGSGLCSLLMDVLQSEGKKLRTGFSVYPSAELSSSILEPYNSTLTCHDAIEHIDIELLFDNVSLFKMCHNRLELPNPTFRHINQILAQVASMLTACNRYENFLYNDLCTLMTNLVPYPRIHFKLSSIAPFSSHTLNAHTKITVLDNTRRVFRTLYQLFSSDVAAGRFLSCSMVYRGMCNAREVYDALKVIKDDGSIRFVDWLPCAFKVGICGEPHVSVEKSLIRPTASSVYMLYGNTCVKDSLQNLCVKFEHMFRKRSFVFWYQAEGMEEEEFGNAVEDIRSVVADYSEIHGQEVAAADQPPSSAA